MDNLNNNLLEIDDQLKSINNSLGSGIETKFGNLIYNLMKSLDEFTNKIEITTNKIEVQTGEIVDNIQKQTQLSSKLVDIAELNSIALRNTLIQYETKMLSNQLTDSDAKTLLSELERS